MRKTPYWLGLLSLAVLVLMPDITVNAQPVPSEQGPNGQMPNEKDQGTDTQTSKGEQTLEEQPTPAGQELSNEEEEQQTQEEQPTPAGQEPSNEEDQPSVMQMTEQILIESGCRYTDSWSLPGGHPSRPNGALFNNYECPAGTTFAGLTADGVALTAGDHPSWWFCLAAPDRIGPVSGGQYQRRGECLISGQGGGGSAATALRPETKAAEGSKAGGTSRTAPSQERAGQGQERADQGQERAGKVQERASKVQKANQSQEEANQSQEEANQSQEDERNESQAGYGCSAGSR